MFGELTKQKDQGGGEGKSNCSQRTNLSKDLFVQECIWPVFPRRVLMDVELKEYQGSLQSNKNWIRARRQG